MNTRALLTHGLVAVLAIGAGLVAGRQLAASPTSTEPVPESITEEPEPRRMVCVSDVSPGKHLDSSAADLALQWCQSQLADCRAQRATLRKPYPDDHEFLGAEEWSAAVEAAFEDCGLPYELEVVECSEYPCVAGLRPKTALTEEHVDDWGNLEFGKDEMKKCPALAEAFGVDGSLISDELGFYEVTCPDGSVEQVVLMYAPGPDIDELEMDGPADPAMEWLRWITRRADDVAAMWTCQ